MDSPVVSHLFRQLFRHQATRSLSYSQPLRAQRSLQPCSCGHQQSRYASRKLGSRRKKEDEDDTIWRHRIDHFPKDMSQELRDYPLVTAVELRNRRERPRRVKMLTRDFIEGMDPKIEKIIQLSTAAQQVYSVNC